MRPPHEIRREILRLRDRNRLTYHVISERSRCTREQIISCLMMKATEETLIRLDAFLNAPSLHKRPSHSLVAYEIENLSRELWREFKEKSPHPIFVAQMSLERQKVTLARMTMSGKARLQERMEKEHGFRVMIPDGDTYWQFKERCKRRLQRAKAVRPGDPYPRGVSGSYRQRQNGQLHNP